MWLAEDWKEYCLLDCGGGERLEKWGRYTLQRPDPQAIWPKTAPSLWKKADAVYHRSSSGGGSWDIKSLPQAWTVPWRSQVFNVKPMSFKHTGVFPEQAANWDFIARQIGRRQGPVSVLNLFAYTGGATLAAAAAGASVCHVDAARGMVSWARENARSSGLGEAPIRYIVDDCQKFVQREIKRGRRYDAIIMDPPSYGRGPTGEIWKFETDIAAFIELCAGVLSDNPLFVIISSYTAGISPSVPAYLLGTVLCSRFGGSVEASELGLVCRSTGLALPCGHTARWTAER